MTTKYIFSNNASTTLAESISATATVINLASGKGDLFPSPTTDEAFPITLVDAATGLTNEICYCTARSGDALTVTRGQENTTATAWSAGDTAANYITAGTINAWLQASDLDGYATETWVENKDYATEAFAEGTFYQSSGTWYWISPSGLIFQGGRASTGSGGQLILSFPYTFPNGILYQNAEESNAQTNWSNGTFAAMVGTSRQSNSLMRIYTTVMQTAASGNNPTLTYFGGLSVTVDWIAIGY